MKRPHETTCRTAATLLITMGLGLRAQNLPVPTVEPAALPAAAPTESRTVDLAICLDTSGSMSGLINAARAGIWAIVNDLALAEPVPKMRVALLTFGNDGHDPATGWVDIGTGFTTDLDLVSQQLFGLSTNGGTELVGRVVQTAVDRLDWSEDPAALKLLVVAGNESADQDREVRYPDACKAAIGRGIQINAIYCGGEGDDLAKDWRDVAQRADGRFHVIDHNAEQVAIATPFDGQLQALNVKLNATYIPFGADGKRGWTNQVAQDKNAVECNEQVVAQRVMAKTTSNYCNSSWDLIDAYQAQTVKLEEIKDSELPESMRGKSLEEKKAFLDVVKQRRAALQTEIQAVAQQRQAKVAEEMKKRALDMSGSFDAAVCASVRAQAAAKGLRFAAETSVVALPKSEPGAAPAPKQAAPKQPTPKQPTPKQAAPEQAPAKKDGC